MNVVEFIKQYGWSKSSMIVFESIGHGANTFYDTHDELYYGQINDIRVSVTELKQYVDAWELVKSYGGLKSAIETYNCFKNACDGVGVKHSPKMIILKQAIELVESVNENN